nr:SigE family RNA polymerase sigma factor [Nocardioides ginsengisegetis]
MVTVASPGLMRLAYMLCGNPHAAEDLLQATFARACRNGERIAAMAAPTAYLRRIMINEHASQHRRRRLATVPLEGDLDPPVPTTSGADDRDEAWRWLATLPPRQRAVLVLRFYEDVPDQEIAQLIGCTQATVRSHASHGLAALRALLTGCKEES